MKTKLNRIEVGGAGLGEASEEDVARRAEELARSDGRTETNESDLAQARGELGAEISLDPAEEIAEDDRPGSGFPETDHGTQAERFEMEDEANLAEELVEEGVREADHDSRLHSNDGKLTEP